MTALIIVKQITLVGCIDWKHGLHVLKRRDLQQQQITVLNYTKALVIQINYVNSQWPVSRSLQANSHYYTNKQKLLTRLG